MAVQAPQLVSKSNDAILNAIRASGTPAYQARIPRATKGRVQDTLKALQTHRSHYNEFVDALVNRIGKVIARQVSWQNPLAEFKTGMLPYGDTIEEIQVGLVQAYSYNPDVEVLEQELFGQAPVEVQANFHTVNRQDKYKITVNQPLLHRAFLSEGGLNSFVEQLMAAPSTSDQWDEFLLMCQLFPEYASNGGFFKVNVPDVKAPGSTSDDAKTALRTMREWADNLTFLSRDFNAAGMPTFADRDKLCIFTTPAFKNALDVEALAAAFNISHAELHGRIIPIPEQQFGIDQCQAILTTSDFFVVADQLLENMSIQNPAGLFSNHWLHHWQVISASRFVPALMFTTGAGDTVPLVITPVASVSVPTITDYSGNTPSSVQRGELYQLTAAAVTNPTGGVNDAVRWTVSGQTSPRTSITAEGVLHVGGDEGASSLTVTATSVWIDSSNLMKDGASANISVNVTGTYVPEEWPDIDTPTNLEVAGVAVTSFAPTTTTYALSVPHAHGAIVASDVQLVGVDTGELTVTVNAPSATPPVAGTTQTVTVYAPNVAGDPTYTVNVTFS